MPSSSTACQAQYADLSTRIGSIEPLDWFAGDVPGAVRKVREALVGHNPQSELLPAGRPHLISFNLPRLRIAGRTDGIPGYSAPCYHVVMKIGVSLPVDLVTFADETARRRGTSRSELLARLLDAERVRQQTQEYLDRHGWDVVDDDAAWRRYQRRRMAEEYRDDRW